VLRQLQGFINTSADINKLWEEVLNLKRDESKEAILLYAKYTNLAKLKYNALPP